jgi:ribA/ribD-fused uncharacterized protein
MQKSDYIFFWGGTYSQWIKSPFTIDGKTFNTAEQWMMYNKAMVFNDTATAKSILETTDPKKQKALGRQVKNFDDFVWMEKSFDIVVKGNIEKFKQNPKMLAELEASKGKIIVEASPYDKRWGIGLAADAPNIEDQSTWQGENLLGKAIMQVRTELFGD